VAAAATAAALSQVLVRGSNPEAKFRTTKWLMVGLVPLCKGFRTLLSSPWYLNLGAYSEENWLRYHAVEPLAFEVRSAVRLGQQLRFEI